MSTLGVLGAGPKALAIAAKAKVLRDLGLGSIDVVLIEQRAVAADWRGTDGWTDGEPHLGTPPEKDIGFPYRSCFGPEVDAAVAAYSWQRCLIDNGIYADWVDRGRPQPQHRAWALYLGWVFDQIRPTLRAARLTQVEAAGDTALALTLERDGTQEALIVDGLVITGPGEPLTLPTISCDNTHCILDGRTFWLKRQLFTSMQGGRVAVIGSGETAASIAVSLLSVPGLSIDIISRRGVIYTRGESYAESHLFSDPELWPELSEQERQEFIQRTDRGVFSRAAQQALDAATNVSITPGAAIGAAVENGGATLTTEWRGQVRRARYDKIIVAIGFDPTSAFSLLSPALRPQLSMDELQRRIDEQLCIPGRNIHMPMLAGLAQGPGFPNLSCLGLLADRVLSRYIHPPELGTMPAFTRMQSEDVGRSAK